MSSVSTPIVSRMRANSTGIQSGYGHPVFYWAHAIHTQETAPRQCNQSQIRRDTRLLTVPCSQAHYMLQCGWDKKREAIDARVLASLWVELFTPGVPTYSSSLESSGSSSLESGATHCSRSRALGRLLRFPPRLPLPSAPPMSPRPRRTSYNLTVVFTAMMAEHIPLRAYP